MTRRFDEIGVAIHGSKVRVAGGVATIKMDIRGPGRRLAESVALTVPGVLEVRFVTPSSIMPSSRAGQVSTQRDSSNGIR
jgi:hypothetical protein